MTLLPTLKDLPMTSVTRSSRRTRRLILAAALGGALLQTACVPLIVGGAAVGSAMVATDRRTSGTQLEDQGIELKTANRIREQLGDRVHINVNSYNRMVLLTGETRNDEDRAAVERIAQGVENVGNVLNEVGVGMLSSLSSRANDVAIAAMTMTWPMMAAFFGDRRSTRIPMTMRRSAPASTGVATIRPFSAWERPRSLAMPTPSGPRMTQTMKARSK